MIFTTSPIPSNVKKYYFEIFVEKEGENQEICIGLTRANPEHKNGRYPGWDKNTVGYHGHTGHIMQDHAYEFRVKSEKFGTGDKVGCVFLREIIDGVPLVLCFFTKNGKYLDTIRCLPDIEYYPTIGMGSNGASIKTNFGDNEFCYNISGKTHKY